MTVSQYSKADKGDSEELIPEFQEGAGGQKRYQSEGLEHAQTCPLWRLNIDLVLQSDDGTGLRFQKLIHPVLVLIKVNKLGAGTSSVDMNLAVTARLTVKLAVT